MRRCLLMLELSPEDRGPKEAEYENVSESRLDLPQILAGSRPRHIVDQHGCSLVWAADQAFEHLQPWQASIGDRLQSPIRLRTLAEAASVYCRHWCCQLAPPCWTTDICFGAI